MKTWKTFLLATIILVVVLTALTFVVKALDNNTRNEIHEHNETCNGTIHFVGANKYAHFYECDTCGHVFRMHELLND